MLNDPDAVTRYRNRAEELRSLADSAKDDRLRADLEKRAKDYDLMATCSSGLKEPDGRGQISTSDGAATTEEMTSRSER